MEPEDIKRFAEQRTAEVAPPLIYEFCEAFGLDLNADRGRTTRMLSDLANRMFMAGYTLGASNTTATFIEQLPPGIHVSVPPQAEELYEGPLGEGPDFDGWEPQT